MRGRWPNRSAASTASGWKRKVFVSNPVTSSSGPGSWMSRSSQKNAPPARACSIFCWLASVAMPLCMSVPFMEGCFHARETDAQEMDASLSGSIGPWAGRWGRNQFCGSLSIRGRVHGGDIGWRGAEAALDVGQPVAYHRQPLAEVGVALLIHLPVCVGVLLDEQRSNRGGKHADEADSHQHEDTSDDPATGRHGIPVTITHGGHGDDGPP